MSISLPSRVVLITILLICSGDLLLVELARTDPVHSSYSGHENRTALFVFGDSLFDAGTNNFINTTTSFQANFFPYGESFFKYPTGRFSNGRLIPDFIAEYAGLPLIPPYLHPKFRFLAGANFASGGAGALVDTYLGLVVNLASQLTLFTKLFEQLKMKFGNKEASRIASKAVYMISIGGNDYLSTFSLNTTLFQSLSHEEYVALVVGNLTTVVKQLHGIGGRKFGFINMGPLGCLPSRRALTGTSGGCYSELNEVMKIHNQALPKALKKLKNELDAFKYAIFDFFNTLLPRINNPSKFGFKVGKTGCCGSGPFRGNYSCGGKRGKTYYELCEDPSEYVIFDSSHPSEKTYKQFAKLMWSGNPPTVGPYNLQALFKSA